MDILIIALLPIVVLGLIVLIGLFIFVRMSPSYGEKGLFKTAQPPVGIAFTTNIPAGEVFRIVTQFVIQSGYRVDDFKPKAFTILPRDLRGSAYSFRYFVRVREHETGETLVEVGYPSKASKTFHSVVFGGDPGLQNLANGVKAALFVEGAKSE